MISHYIREIGRGKDGARPLDRAQAADLFGQVLDGAVTDLELGAFCIAMRIKGETPQELAGFLEATHARLNLIPAPTNSQPLVVLPSYNGARKLPVLTPLLALLLAQRGCAVVLHGLATEDARVFVPNVLAALDLPAKAAIQSVAPGEVAYFSTELLLPGLARLLKVRRVVGLRNSGHSIVKLMNPCAGPAVLVASYTHTEYAHSMAATFEATGATAMLLRGTEGEVVADARKLPRMEGFVNGQRLLLEEGEKGIRVPEPGSMPAAADAHATARYIRAVLKGDSPLPHSISLQVAHILSLVQASSAPAQTAG